MVLLDVMMPGMDGFEVCRRLKAEPRTQHIPVIMVNALDHPSDRVKGLEAGADDFLTKPVDDVALITRVRNLARLKMLTDEMLMRASQRGKPLSLLLLDIDYFKSVNDSHGHDAGDSLLREFASRGRRNIRGIDLACRLGGEEFVVVMPDTDLAKAYHVGERLRQCIRGSALLCREASVGVASLEFADDTPELILKRADQALYCAKRDGRNRGSPTRPKSELRFDRASDSLVGYLVLRRSVLRSALAPQGCNGGRLSAFPSNHPAGRCPKVPFHLT